MNIATNLLSHNNNETKLLLSGSDLSLGGSTDLLLTVLSLLALFATSALYLGGESHLKMHKLANEYGHEVDRAETNKKRRLTLTRRCLGSNFLA